MAGRSSRGSRSTVTRSRASCEQIVMTARIATSRIATLPLAAALLVALALGAQRADAATYLGSPDTTADPDAYVCAACPAGTTVGFLQFALRGATVEAPEDGVLVAASVHAKRIAGIAQPRIAVLRAAEGDGVGMTIVDSAPLPVSSPAGALHEVENLRLRVERGDSIGLLFAAGEVDLGMRVRPRPDGAVQSFVSPCDPCGMDGGTGVELLFDAVVEPDVDEDGLGDESQDADGGGLGLDWEDDWFEDFEEGDELDEDLFDDAAPAARRRLRLLDVDRRRGKHATLLLRVPKAGRLSAAITRPGDRLTGAGPFLTILTGEKRVRRAGRVRLRMYATTPGARLLARRPRLRTKVVVSLLPRKGSLKVLMRSARLYRPHVRSAGLAAAAGRAVGARAAAAVRPDALDRRSA
jgi:hypothetical protein